MKSTSSILSLIHLFSFGGSWRVLLHYRCASRHSVPQLAQIASALLLRIRSLLWLFDYSDILLSSLIHDCFLSMLPSVLLELMLLRGHVWSIVARLLLTIHLTGCISPAADTSGIVIRWSAIVQIFMLLVIIAFCVYKWMISCQAHHFTCIIFLHWLFKLLFRTQQSLLAIMSSVVLVQIDHEFVLQIINVVSRSAAIRDFSCWNFLWLLFPTA